MERVEPKDPKWQWGMKEKEKNGAENEERK